MTTFVVNLRITKNIVFMAIIRIKNLKINTLIGFLPEERLTPQQVIVNAEIEVDADRAVETDNPDYVYDYKEIKKSIIVLVERSNYLLLEKLTAAILQLIMADTRVVRAKVEVDKPFALRFADSVSVEMEEYRGTKA